MRRCRCVRGREEIFCLGQKMGAVERREFSGSTDHQLTYVWQQYVMQSFQPTLLCFETWMRTSTCLSLLPGLLFTLRVCLLLSEYGCQRQVRRNIAFHFYVTIMDILNGCQLYPHPPFGCRVPYSGNIQVILLQFNIKIKWFRDKCQHIINL